MAITYNGCSYVFHVLRSFETSSLGLGRSTLVLQPRLAEARPRVQNPYVQQDASSREGGKCDGICRLSCDDLNIKNWTTPYRLFSAGMNQFHFNIQVYGRMALLCPGWYDVAICGEKMNGRRRLQSYSESGIGELRECGEKNPARLGRQPNGFVGLMLPSPRRASKLLLDKLTS